MEIPTTKAARNVANMPTGTFHTFVSPSRKTCEPPV
jgi:hypothetical protein